MIVDGCSCSGTGDRRLGLVNVQKVAEGKRPALALDIKDWKWVGKEKEGNERGRRRRRRRRREGEMTSLSPEYLYPNGGRYP
jgi:hypothetical protein